MVQTIITPTIPPVIVKLPKGRAVISYGVLKVAAAKDPVTGIYERSVPMYVARALGGHGCLFSDRVPGQSVAELLEGAEEWQAAWLIHAHGQALGRGPRIRQALWLLAKLGEPPGHGALMVEPKAEFFDGRMVPFSQCSNEDLACIAHDPRCDVEHDATSKFAPGFHRQYALILLRERITFG